MKTTLIILLAAVLTVALAPSAARAALRGFWRRDFPLSPYGFEPKYAIGGRYVTREEFEAWPPAPVTDLKVHVDQFGVQR